MRMNPHLFSSLFLSSLLTFISELAANPDMKCEVSRCGNVTEISYPFWLSGEQPSYCGFPAFELQCKDDIPLIETPYGEYEVKKIFYGNNSFLVADTSFNHLDCPFVYNNVSFDDTPFKVSSSANRMLYFLSSCSRADSDYFFIACPDKLNRTNKFAYLGGDYRADGYSEIPCSDVAYRPVLGYPGANSNQYKTLMKNGFLLNWTVSDCDQCTNSKGQCGYSNQTENFICICPDRLHWKRCDGKNKKVIAIAASVGGTLVLIAICCIALLYKRRKRLKRSGVSNLLSHSTSSQLSSKKDAELGDSSYHTHIFSYEELQVATNGFDSSRELGDGGFGTVYKGTLRDGRTVAVKRLFENNYRRLEQFMNEVAILSRLRHQNLVTLYGCTSRHSRELILVYEFVPNGTIADHLHGTIASVGPLPWNVRMSIAIETAYALAYLHAVEPPIIHRDVKSNNILLDNNFHVKVADFGLSRLFPLDVTHVSTAPQGTPGYVDPEYHQCYQLTDKSDVYSFGVVLVELISSKPAVDISRSRHEINLANMAVTKIQNRQLDQLVDPLLGYQSDTEVTRMITQVAELAFTCLQSDRDLRPSIKEVLEVLKAIYNVGYEVEKSEAAEAQIREESKLLKNAASPFSPDSVTDKWQSSLTTPNNSG